MKLQSPFNFAIKNNSLKSAHFIGQLNWLGETTPPTATPKRNTEPPPSEQTTTH
jgi:hypothetical protein